MTVKKTAKSTPTKVVEKVIQIPASNATYSYSQPYILTVKNLTDEKLYAVEVLNSEFEKQNKVDYCMGVHGVNYYHFLQQVFHRHDIDEKSLNNKVHMLRVRAYCEFGKFQTKQLYATLGIGYHDAHGNKTTRPLSLSMDAYQQQPNIIDKKIPEDFNFYFNRNLRITLPYLMPETEVTFYFYLAEK